MEKKEEKSFRTRAKEFIKNIVAIIITYLVEKHAKIMKRYRKAKDRWDDEFNGRRVFTEKLSYVPSNTWYEDLYFVNTDIINSTYLWNTDVNMRKRVDIHHRMGIHHIKKCYGHCFRVEGDSFLAAFERLDDAKTFAEAFIFGLETVFIPDEFGIRVGISKGNALMFYNIHGCDFEGEGVAACKKLCDMGKRNQINFQLNIK